MGLNVGDSVVSSPAADIKPGNALPMANIPVGTFIHNIELYPGKGAQLVRSAGDAAQLMAKENGMATVRLPSGEMRKVRMDCYASIGQVGNIDHANVKLGKLRHEPGRSPARRRRRQVPRRPSRPCDPVGQARTRLQDPQDEEPHR